MQIKHLQAFRPTYWGDLRGGGCPKIYYVYVFVASDSPRSLKRNRLRDCLLTPSMRSLALGLDQGLGLGLEQGYKTRPGPGLDQAWAHPTRMPWAAFFGAEILCAGSNQRHPDILGQMTKFMGAINCNQGGSLIFLQEKVSKTKSRAPQGSQVTGHSKNK